MSKQLSSSDSSSTEPPSIGYSTIAKSNLSEHGANPNAFDGAQYIVRLTHRQHPKIQKSPANRNRLL